eukprot:657829-Pleurochrysis_carterae.AAC.1
MRESLVKASERTGARGGVCARASVRVLERVQVRVRVSGRACVRRAVTPPCVCREPSSASSVA